VVRENFIRLVDRGISERSGGSGISLGPTRFVPRTQWLGEVFRLMGQADSARVYYEAAITELEGLLSIPSHLSAAVLRMDPRWDPLREHPRFRRLVGQ
jgi:hypothetical protein